MYVGDSGPQQNSPPGSPPAQCRDAGMHTLGCCSLLPSRGAGGCVLQVGWDWETPLRSHTTPSPFPPWSFPAAPSPRGPRRRLLGPPPALALKLCK